MDELALANLFLEKYPNSEMLFRVEDYVEALGKYDVSDSSESVYVGNDYYVISVEKFRSVNQDSKRVDFVYDGVSCRDKKEGDKCEFSGGYVLVEDVDAGRARLSVYVECFT